ncbi:outer membrane beta-barrel protein [Aliikangiella maris]|uniref:Outer membrane beta-barrel protein n=2 Tax=Aliikangiella maris TaxID=3162458 RepID=A0ABV3MRV3_9GAMM
MNYLKELTSLALILSSTSTFAASPFSDSPGTNHGIFHVTAKVGQTKHTNVSTDPLDLVSNLSGTATSYGINFDMSLTEYFSAGLGFVDFGEALILRDFYGEYDTGEDVIEVLESSYMFGEGITASLMLHTDPKNGPWFFFARAGIINSEVGGKTKETYLGKVIESSMLKKASTEQFYGVGVAYYISNTTKVGMDYNRYNMQYSIVDEDTIDKYEHDLMQTSFFISFSF